MHIIRFSVLLGILLFPVIGSVSAQSLSVMNLCDIVVDPECCNRTDIDGGKTGLWVNEDSAKIILSYYHDGKKNGVERVFKKNGDGFYLHKQCFYNNSAIAQPCFIFHANGMLAANISRMTEVETKSSVVLQSLAGSEYIDGTFVQYYQQLYDECGRKITEGWSVSPDFSLIGNFEAKIGVWECFSADGKSYVQYYNDPKWEYVNE